MYACIRTRRDHTDLARKRQAGSICLLRQDISGAPCMHVFGCRLLGATYNALSQTLEYGGCISVAILVDSSRVAQCGSAFYTEGSPRTTSVARLNCTLPIGKLIMRFPPPQCSPAFQPAQCVAHTSRSVVSRPYSMSPNCTRLPKEALLGPRYRCRPRPRPRGVPDASGIGRWVV